jgi:hypothetical protein
MLCVEVHASTEDAIGGVGGGEDDAANAGIAREEVVGRGERIGHFIGKAIASGGTVEKNSDDGGYCWGRGRMVEEFEGGKRMGFIRGWKRRHGDGNVDADS